MSKTPQPSVYSYIRFSTAEQRHGTGRGRQEAAAKAWCEKHGVQMADAAVYRDLGCSAYRGRNAEVGALSKFLACVESGQIAPGSTLLIESLDRLSRDTATKALPIFLSIINAGVKLVTLADQQEFSSGDEPAKMASSLMYSLMVFIRSNDESRMKAVRKSGAWSASRKAALSEGKPLRGNHPAWITIKHEDGCGSFKGQRCDCKNPRYIVDKAAADRVRKIFKDYTDGGMGLFLLNKKYGIAKPTIAYWLNNPIALGHVTIRDNDKVVELRNHYPPIITEAVWRRAQARKAENFIARTPRGRIGHVNIFSGLLFDASGHSFDVQRHGGISSYTSPHAGCVIRCRALELGIAYAKLSDKLVVTRVVETDEVSPEVKAVESKIASIQKEMIDGGMVEVLLPVLKALQQQKKDLEVNQNRRVVRQVDPSMFDGLLNDTADRETRLRMRDAIRQCVEKIIIEKATVEGWNCHIKGRIVMRPGYRDPKGKECHELSFGVAYNSRRAGSIITDVDRLPFAGKLIAGWRRFTGPVAIGQMPGIIKADRLTPELIEELNELPMTYTRSRKAKAAAK